MYDVHNISSLFSLVISVMIASCLFIDNENANVSSMYGHGNGQ